MWLATGQWFSWVSSTKKTACHDITEILLKVALNNITLTLIVLSSGLQHCNWWKLINIKCYQKVKFLSILTWALSNTNLLGRSLCWVTIAGGFSLSDFDIRNSGFSSHKAHVLPSIPVVVCKIRMKLQIFYFSNN
jgi:hypothetical protein